MAPNTYKREGIAENVDRVVEHFMTYYRMAHEKPACHLVDQREPRFRTLYRKLNKCK